ncbi:uncharacterized protein LOC143861868 [Tasmannia lanceolata]|uniref:uncharacterized protein LOC143861868 n=1 Tax=Tasmannia lanceolata TaxID=3420 RepID=UPI0040642C0C
MVQYLLEDESEIGAFEERVRKLSENLEKAQAEKVALVDTVSQLRVDLRQTVDGRSRAEERLVVARQKHAGELAKAREEWRDSEEFLKAVDSFSVDIEIDAFIECRRRVCEVDPSFPLEKLVHEAEEGVPEDLLPAPVETPEPVEDQVAALEVPVVTETSEGAQ